MFVLTGIILNGFRSWEMPRCGQRIMSKVLIACGRTVDTWRGCAIAESLQDSVTSAFVDREKQVDSKLIQKYGRPNFYKTPGQGFSLRVTSLPVSICCLFAGFLFSVSY